MGDRTTWAIVTDEETEKAIWLYSHNGGWSKLDDTRNALRAARPRWNDVSYCARIIVSQIIGDDWNSEYGFGLLAGDIYNPPFEEERYYLTIDIPNQWIVIGAEDWKGTFEEFMNSEFDYEELDEWKEQEEEN